MNIFATEFTIINDLVGKLHLYFLLRKNSFITDFHKEATKYCKEIATGCISDIFSNFDKNHQSLIWKL